MNRTSCVLAVVVGVAVLAGCGSADGKDSSYGFTTGALMLPGENCLRCHSAKSAYPGAPAWTVGGTVFATADADDSAGVPGAVVEITDKTGRKIELTANAAGNFYTREPLTPPFRVALEYDGKRAEMPIEAPAGSCNACHSYPDSTGGTKGRIRITGAAPPVL